MALPLGPTGTAGDAPARSPLALFVALCLGFSVLLHAEPLAAAAELHLQPGPGVVAGIALAVAALFNLAILSLNFLVARQPAAAAGGPTPPQHTAATAGTAPVPTASTSTTPLSPFMAMGLCLAMSAALHAEPLVDAAAAVYQTHPAIVVCVLLFVAALFNWAIISLNFRLARRPAAAGGPTPLPHPAATAGTAPVPTASVLTTPLAPFMALCLAMSAALHAEPLVDAAAAVYQIHPAIVVCVLLSVAALFNWAIISLNFRVARRPAAAGGATPLLHPAATAGAAPVPTTSASTTPIATFMGLCIAMSAALHAEPLVAAATEYQIHPAVVVFVVLAGSALFHLAILSVHKSLARRQAELPRSRSRGLPLLPFLVLALTIPTVSSAETVIAAGATDLAQSASVWALLALAVSFNIAIGSLYCIVINGRAPSNIAGVKMRPRSEAACAIVSCITTAGVLVSCMFLTSGAASGAIAARR